MIKCYNLQTCSETSSLENDIRLCAKVGFPCVEINFDKAKDYLKEHTLDDLGRLLKENNIYCATINAIFGLSFSDWENWKRIRKDLRFAMDLCHAAGTDKIIVLCDQRIDLPEGVTEEEIFEDTVIILRRIADIAATEDIKIAFEPVGTMAIGNAAIAVEVVKAADRENLGLAIDAFNLYLWDLGSDYDQLSQIDPKMIYIVHLNDAEKIPFAMIDQDHRCMPGDGRADIKAYVSALEKAGYQGEVSVEVLNSRIWAKGPEVVIPEAYEKISKFI